MGATHTAVPGKDMPCPLNDMGSDQCHPGPGHTQNNYAATTDPQGGLFSSPAILRETLLSRCFSANTNIPPAYSTNYKRSRLGYFSLTFTDDLVMTYIVHVWEYPRLIVLKLLLYIFCEGLAFLRFSLMKLWRRDPTNKFRMNGNQRVLPGKSRHVILLRMRESSEAFSVK